MKKQFYVVLFGFLIGAAGLAVASFGLDDRGALVDKPTSHQMLAMAYPNDADFLFDQIEIELRPTATSEKKFRVATRPGQFLLVGLPVENEPRRIRQYAFVVHPEVHGEVIVDHSKLEGVPKSEIKFNVLPLCLEETPSTQSGAEGPIDIGNRQENCRSRDRYIRYSDDVIGFEPISGISIGEEEDEHNSGISFTVLDYRIRPEISADNLGTLAKACMDADGVKVCACQVSLDREIKTAGCQ